MNDHLAALAEDLGVFGNPFTGGEQLWGLLWVVGNC